MGARYLTDLADVLRAAGLVVVEQDGWQTRARGSGGYEPGRPVAVAWHHTASGTSSTAQGDADYMSHGSENAPVANLLVARDGSVWVLAAGATNTEGQGGPLTLPSGVVIPTNEANARVIGMEIQNTGVGQDYTGACVAAAFATSLACSAAYGFGPDDVFTHALGAGDGWTSRKIDPATATAVEGGWQPTAVTSSGTWSQSDLRAELGRRASSPVPKPEPPTPIPPEDDDMAPFIIINNNTGQPALVYGDGRLTGLAGEDLAAYEARFGPAIPTNDVVFRDMSAKG